jgi:hypothetical protein
LKDPTQQPWKAPSFQAFKQCLDFDLEPCEMHR